MFTASIFEAILHCPDNIIRNKIVAEMKWRATQTYKKCDLSSW